MIIDAHQHFWQYDAERHSWIDESMAPIRRSFMPADLKPLLRQAGVAGTILVQVDQTLAENDFFLELAQSNPWILGVVGWIDLQAKDIEEQLEALRSKTLLKGFRHIAQAEPDFLFLAKPSVVSGIKALSKKGFTYDILVYPHQLPAAIELVAQCPDQPFVLDHLAKPYIKSGDIEGWQKDIQRLSTYENVWVKLSGLVTEADWEQWQPQHIYPYLEVALQVFGAERLMWGSDWPVCLVASNYQQVLQLVQEFISPLSAYEQASIMADNALQFYNCAVPAEPI
jgi:L-fuconolactonase